MCGGGGGSDSPLAMQSANQEAIRQANIKEGMQQIETMFSGGKRPVGRVGTDAKYDPNQSYYDQGGNKLALQDAALWRMLNPNSASALALRAKETPVAAAAPSMPDNPYYNPPAVIDPNDPNAGFNSSPYGQMYNRAMGIDPNAGKPPPSAAETSWATALDEQTMQEQMAALQASGVYTGITEEGGYQPAFYDKAYKAQLDYSLPQVDQQFEKAQRELTFALARQGLNASSQGTQLQTELGGQRDLAIQGEQDKARTVRNQQIQSVEAERDNLTKLLQSTGDVASTMNAAAARKSVLDAAPALQEVGPLFQNATGTLADMIVNPALRAAGQTSVNKGYGSTAKGSGKVVT